MKTVVLAEPTEAVLLPDEQRVVDVAMPVGVPLVETATGALVTPPGPLLTHEVNIQACSLATQRIACKMYLGYQENNVNRTATVPWDDLSIDDKSNWCAAAIAALPNINHG